MMPVSEIERLSNAINDQLKKTDVQLCFYNKRLIVKKGSKLVVKDNCLYINGRGPAIIPGSFKAYKYI